MPSIDWPSEGESQQFLAKLLDGDPTATADFLAAFYPPLIAHVRSRNPKLDESAHHDAAVEAIVSLVKNPRSYSPEAGLSLESYLKMSAAGDLRNLLRKEQKHRIGRNPIEDVEPAAPAGNDDLEMIDEVRHVTDTILPEVKRGLSPEQLAGLDLLLAGERSSAAFAAALKLTDEGPEPAVKAFKDMIKKRIQRASKGAP